MKLKVDLAGDVDETTILDVLNGKTAYPEAKEPKQFIAHAHQELLQHIDEWIDSGRNADGSESPYQRRCDRAPKAWEDARSFFEYFRYNVDWQLIPGEPPQLRLRPRKNRVWGALEARVRNGLILASVLLSDLRLRLAKCRYRNCGRRYFLLSHPREKAYANGLFCCTEHNRKEAAMRGTKERRQQTSDRLIEFAARELSRYGERPRGKERLVTILNQKIANDPNQQPRHELKVNWVTRHLQEIQKKAKELSHA
jgi:hypothetical protein